MMYTDDHEKRWMAYLDGQMSASEVIDFEQSISARDRARLDGEVRLESAINDSLAGGGGCPAGLWNDLSRRMRQPAPARPGRFAYWASRTTIVLAATTAIVIGVPHFTEYSVPGQGAGSQGSVAIAAETTREEFSEGLEAGPSLAAAQQYLQDNRINLRLVHVADSGETMHGQTMHKHKLEFLGACRGNCPEGSLFELRFWCCGEPAKLLIARRGTGGERTLRNASRCGDARDARSTGEYVIAVVGGGDHSQSLLDLLQPFHGNLT